MSPAKFKAIRLGLGLSASQTAQALGLSDGRVIRLYEAGQSKIGGPVQRLMREFEDGTIDPI